jgi:serine/threonine-protein kinase
MSKELEHKPEDSEPEISICALHGGELEHDEGSAALRGEAFANYLLVGEIARGGMGEIFLGMRQGLEGFSKMFVIKRMAGHLTKDNDFLRMFIEEARLAARLEHPNIVKTYEFGDHEGQYYTVMEYLAGEDLHTILNQIPTTRHNQIPLPLAVHIVSQICNGLHFAHELTDHEGSPLNLVHRDINPANIIVTYTGEVKIIDFGVAKVSTAAKKTLAGVIKGRVAYMSPENILARGVDRRSDVFSAGIILWELLVGRPLFARDGDAATMYAVLNDPIPKPSKERPDVPPQLDALVARALSRTPATRFASADDMRAALDRVAASLPKVDGRAIGQMMEDAFGSTRAHAKRSITQLRSLARNIPLVMRTPTTLSARTPPPGTVPAGSLVRAEAPAAAPTAIRRNLSLLVIASAVASVVSVAVIATFGPWRSANPGWPAAALAARAPSGPTAAGVDAGASPAPPVPAPAGTRAQGRAQGTLSLKTRPNAVVYLDGEPIGQGSFSRRPIPNGPHELSVKIPGRAPLSRSISIVAERETRLKIDPVQRPAADAREWLTPGRASVKAEPRVARAGAPVAPAVKQPRFDLAAARAAVRSQLGPVQRCYQRARFAHANLKGEVMARMTVNADGSIANVQIASSTLRSPQVEGCITREILRWRVPPPAKGAVVGFSYPLVFE